MLRQSDAHARHDRPWAEHAHERGAAVIEFALVLPILAMLVVGLFSSAMLYDAKMQLTHAAREGARYGATVPDGQTFPLGGTWATNVRALVIQREGGIPASGVCVALVAGSPAVPISSGHTTNPSGGACFDDSASGEVERRVQVSLAKDARLDVVAFSRDVVLTASASSRHESRG